MSDAPGRRKRRIAITVLTFPLIVAVSSVALAFMGSDELDAVAAAVFLIPIAIFGAVIARAWVLLLPTIWSLLFLAVLRIYDLLAGTCSVCGSDEDWGNYHFFFIAFALIPMTAALTAGVGIGVLARGLSRVASDEPPQRVSRRAHSSRRGH
ncbi:hypothetical protein DVA67_025570 [Solirubrobacter sp. CPCC 204708]|uniref:Integral membrane protein n=1 Tax=Solirubrobacter deserti TaxID=2282478 RepID=A0ABT4RQM9_9ACTN|nr:hypothetical protein [Solirubrobacter deserti]MBE2319371.1 hypothetical protein [Solirubrobacter deserti]MDA0140869.1 hypothetical protein [Solirubrobacter deserti]